MIQYVEDIMIVNLMPTYQCNNNCSYCYLGDLRNRTRVIDPKVLLDRLSELSERSIIDTINIFGGEVSIIDYDEFSNIISIVNSFSENISIITNFSNVSWVKQLLIDHPNIWINTSINDERPNNDSIKLSLLQTDIRDVTITMVTTKSLYYSNYEKLLNFLSKVSTSLDIMQFFPSIENRYHWNVDFDRYDDIVLKLIHMQREYFPRYRINNEYDILSSIRGEYIPTMDSHVFITPNSNFAYLHFINGIETFRECTLEEYDIAVAAEYKMYKRCCSTCDYFGNCYAEHLNPYILENGGCCGHKRLLQKYKTSFMDIRKK